MDLSAGSRCHTISCSLNFDWLWFSVPVSICCKEGFLCCKQSSSVLLKYTLWFPEHCTQVILPQKDTRTPLLSPDLHVASAFTLGGCQGLVLPWKSLLLVLRTPTARMRCPWGMPQGQISVFPSNNKVPKGMLFATPYSSRDLQDVGLTSQDGILCLLNQILCLLFSRIPAQCQSLISSVRVEYLTLDNRDQSIPDR